MEIWDLTSYTRRLTIELTDLHQQLVTFLPDSIHFLVGPALSDSTDSASYDVWNLQTARVEDHLVEKEGALRNTILSPNANYIADVIYSVDNNGTLASTIQLMSNKTLEVLRQFC